mgnify:CR=1 FL=1
MTDAPLHLLIAHKTKADTSIECDEGVRHFFARIGGLGAGLCVVDKSLSKAHVIVLSYYNNTVTVDD